MGTSKPAGPVTRIGFLDILGLVVLGIIVWMVMTGNIKVTDQPTTASPPPPTTTAVPSQDGFLSQIGGKAVATFPVVTPKRVPPELDRQVTYVAVDNNFVSTGQQPSECKIHPNWPQSIQQWCGWITYYGNLNSYDPNWAAAQMWQESVGNPKAQSNKCATGLIQVMPSDGKFNTEGFCDLGSGTNDAYYTYYSGVFRNRPTMSQLEDPEYNLYWGLNYMGNLVKDHGSIWEALLYYGGVGYGDEYRGAVKSHYDCIVNQQDTCSGGLQ